MEKLVFFNGEWEADVNSSLLGEGTNGKVYKARKVGTNSNIYSAIKQIKIPKDNQIIKELKLEGLSSEEIDDELKCLKDEYVKEIVTMYKLKDSVNVVNVEDYEVLEIETPGKDINKKYVINIRMELLESITSLLKDDNLTDKEALKIGLDIANALIECDEKKIIHRDVKIDNIFKNKNNLYKLGDFGEAKNIEKTLSSMTRRGTKNYMAPELYKGEKANKTVDIYSLGIVLYRLFNEKKLPFINLSRKQVTSSEKEDAIMRRINGDTIPAPVAANDNVKNIILKCLEYNPNDRYQSAKDLYDDLKIAYDKIDIPEKIFTASLYEFKDVSKSTSSKTINIIKIINVTKEEMLHGCVKELEIDGINMKVDIPSNVNNKDEIVIDELKLKENNILNKKVTIVISEIKTSKNEVFVKNKNNKKYFLWLIVILIIILVCGTIKFRNNNDNNNLGLKKRNLVCTVSDVSKEDGQKFIYKFYFDKTNNKINKIEFDGTYPLLNSRDVTIDINNFSNLLTEYYCDDKIVPKDSCNISNHDNHINLKFNINVDEYLKIYEIKRKRMNTLLFDLRDYYVNRKEDACEEIFTISVNSCEEKFKTECIIEDETN